MSDYFLNPEQRARRFAELVALCTPLACLLPRLTVTVLILLALAALTLPSARKLLSDMGNWRHPALLLPFALLAYLCANASWAFDPSEAYLKVMAIVAVVLCVLVATSAVRSLDANTLRYAQIALLVALTFVLAVVFAGWLTDRAFMRMIYNLFPFVRPDNEKIVTVVDGYVVFAGMPQLNRTIGMTALLIWPALLIIRQVFRGGSGFWLAAGFFAFSALVVGVSWHQSSQLALIGSAFIFALSQWSVRHTRMALALFWCLSFLMAVPLANTAYESIELHEVTWLPKSARARVIIWGETAARIPDSPWVGVGIRSTRFFDPASAQAAAPPKDQVFGKRTGRHAHNFYLQSWFELGAVGVALVMACGVALLFGFAHLPLATQAYANATFTVFAIMGAFSWGMWQTWLIAGWGLLFVYSCLASRQPVVRRQPQRRSPA